MGGEVLDFVWRAYLTCIERKSYIFCCFFGLALRMGAG
jgi:hypothetical protein